MGRREELEREMRGEKARKDEWRGTRDTPDFYMDRRHYWRGAVESSI